MADKTDKTQGLLTSSQFEQLLKRLPQQQQQPSKTQQAIGNLLKGTASAANKMLSVHGKRLSLEGKIVRKDLYLGGKGMNAMINPLGIAIEKPMDLYTVAKPRIASQGQMRQRANMFGVTKLRLW